MNFYKIKHIGVTMDGTIICRCVGCEVTKTTEGWHNQYGERMTPLFDIQSGELAGFFNPETITIEFEED